jgi:DUF4097 and DUF4098 domain-containing protein YvlB
MPKVHRNFLIAGLFLLSTVPTLASTRIERELKVDRGGTVALETSGGSIHVVGGSRSDVHVVLSSKREIEKDYDVTFGEEAGKATVRVKRKHDVSHWISWGNSGVDLEVEVPSDVKLEADTSGGTVEVRGVRGELRLATSGGAIRGTDVGGDVFADTSGGEIELTRVDGDVRAETSGGGIRVEAAKGGVYADTSGGSIEIEDAGGDIHAETSGGGIRILAARGRVEAETSGGPVRVEFSAGNAKGGSLSSSGGGVTVSVDPSVGLNVDASTSGGSVHADVPVKVHGEISKSELRGTIGEGGAMLKLRSSGGGIRIEQAER